MIHIELFLWNANKLESKYGKTLTTVMVECNSFLND